VFSFAYARVCAYAYACAYARVCAYAYACAYALVKTSLYWKGVGIYLFV